MPVVFFDTNALYIQGYRDSFTAGSLTADYTLAGVGIRVLHGTEYLANDKWTNYARPDGSSFASAPDLMAYLTAQFSMRRPLGFSFAQVQPSVFWLISHPLGYRPAVTLIDTAGDPMTADWRYPDESTVTVTFSAPTAGTAYLS